jgi:hypothetical protein
MTKIEWDCRLEWIEAAIAWHYAEAKKHSVAAYQFDQYHHELCCNGSVA